MAKVNIKFGTITPFGVFFYPTAIRINELRQNKGFLWVAHGRSQMGKHTVSVFYGKEKAQKTTSAAWIAEFVF